MKFLYYQKLILGLLNALEIRFKNIFNIVDEGTTSAVTAAFHPKFKLNWLVSLNSKAQANVMAAIKLTLNQSHQESTNGEEFFEEDDFFDFTNYSENDSGEMSTSLHTFGTSDPEAMYQKFLAHKSSDFSILDLYPNVKRIFIKFNTPLPSSAPVERLFSYATMFNLPKFNKLSDSNFELRVIMKCNLSAAKKN